MSARPFGGRIRLTVPNRDVGPHPDDHRLRAQPRIEANGLSAVPVCLDRTLLVSAEPARAGTVQCNPVCAVGPPYFSSLIGTDLSCDQPKICHRRQIVLDTRSAEVVERYVCAGIKLKLSLTARGILDIRRTTIKANRVRTPVFASGRLRQPVIFPLGRLAKVYLSQGKPMREMVCNIASRMRPAMGEFV